jgi:hypothetical protein
MSPAAHQPVPAGMCRDCRSFHGAAREVEAAFPGMTAMGSGFGAVRAGDGLCQIHARYLAGHCSCASFAPRQGG